jgi:hypothetical protein
MKEDYENNEGKLHLKFEKESLKAKKLNSGQELETTKTS